MDALERKIRPIYDALDAGNSKQALSLCNKLIKKSDAIPIIKALKALALERLNKPDEAFQLCTEVRSLRSTDEAVLQAMALVYRARTRHQDLIAMYEAAFKQQPNDQEIANHWFMALVRSGADAKDLQQSAIKLNKQFSAKTDRYLFWVIMTVYLQALSSSLTFEASGTTSSLQQNSLNYALAERMIAKQADENRLKDQEQLLLYLMILEAQDKNLEAVKLLNGDLKSLCPVESDHARLVSGFYRRAKNWKLLEFLSLENLNRNLDDWESYMNYFDALFQNSQSLDVQVVLNYMKDLQERTLSESKPSRGPFLAELEFLRRLVAIDKKSSDSLLTPIVRYMELFGVNFNCFDDLRPSLNILSREDGIHVVKALSEKYDTQLEDNNQSIDQCKRHVNIRKIERLVTPISSSSSLDVMKEVDLLLSRYDSALKLGMKLTEKERQYGDDYLTLACHYLIDLFQSTCDVRKLFESAVLLERGLIKSKFNFQFKILLICVYRELGVYCRTLDLAKTLDLKQILYDTLSYVYNDDLEMFGCLQEGRNNIVLKSLLQTLKFYSNSERETPEMIVRAFQYSTFSKIPEFMKFRNRLRNSVQRAICHVQIIRIEVLRKWNLDKSQLNLYLQTIEADWDLPSSNILNDFNYSDNRDSKIMADWQAIKGDDTLKEKIASRIRRGRISPRNRTTWLKLYTLIPRILKSICALANGDLISETVLEQVLKDAKQTDDPDVVCECKVGQIVVGLSKLYGLVLSSVSKEEVSNELSDINMIVLDILTLLKDLLKSCSNYKNQPVVLLSQDWLRDATLLLESITYCLFAIQNYTMLLQSMRKNSPNNHGLLSSHLCNKLSDGLKIVTLEFYDGVLTDLNKKLKSQSKQQFGEFAFSSDDESPCSVKQISEFKDEVISHVMSSWMASVECLLNETRRRRAFWN